MQYQQPDIVVLPWCKEYTLNVARQLFLY